MLFGCYKYRVDVVSVYADMPSVNAQLLNKVVIKKKERQTGQSRDASCDNSHMMGTFYLPEG